jgi:C4-dicarboxylate-specific signal transduction histidine kinase
MVVNVLSNATRAAGPSGEMAIEIRRDLGMTVLTVEDSGPGFGMIPANHGIGLAAAAGNLARYGGRVEYGRGSSGGARVSLWLP